MKGLTSTEGGAQEKDTTEPRVAPEMPPAQEDCSATMGRVCVCVCACKGVSAAALTEACRLSKTARPPTVASPTAPQGSSGEGSDTVRPTCAPPR